LVVGGPTQILLFDVYTHSVLHTSNVIISSTSSMFETTPIFYISHSVSLISLLCFSGTDFLSLFSDLQNMLHFHAVS
jgi:hypothetical protein